MNKNEKLNEIVFSFFEISIAILFVYFAYTKQTFYAIQCLFFCLCMFIPCLIQLLFKMKIVPFMWLIYENFLVAHFILGEILSFYITYKYYDIILHFSSAICICLFGYSIIHYYLDFSFYSFQIFFSFLFGLASEFFWEIIEYAIDDIFHTNMQRYMKGNQVFLGHFALTDTIKDMIVAVIGCFIFLLIIKINKIKNIKIIKIEKNP